MKQPTIHNLDAIVERIKQLYITTPHKYIVQQKNTNGGYWWVDCQKKQNQECLNDYQIKKHLIGETTIGVFSLEDYSKFMTFDVDCKDDEIKARKLTLDLINTLTKYGIRKEDIHVSFSGKKGYHVDLFFNQLIPLHHLKAFYMTVVKDVGATTKDVEFRPTFKQGIKLPLGIHQGTGKRCWFVNRDTLEPIENYNYLLNVQPMDAYIILQKDFGFVIEIERKGIDNDFDDDFIVMNWKEIKELAATVIKTGRLVESGTRHKATYALAIYYRNVYGWTEDKVIENILNVLYNTPPNYFDSKPEFWAKETERIVREYVFKKDYYLANVKIYKSEMLEVLKCGKFNTKNTLFHLIIASKQYGEIFNFPESIAEKRLNCSNSTFWKAIKRLEKGGFIEVVERHVIDKEQSKEKGHAYFQPNKYRLLIPPPSEDEPYAVVNCTSDMVEVAWSLFSEEEIKDYVKQREYRNRWKPKKPVTM